jgi:hypothetical protein
MNTRHRVTATGARAPRRPDPKDPAFQAIRAGQQFLASTGPLTPARLAELEGLLRDLAAVRWEDTGRSSREVGWLIWLRLCLLKYCPGHEGRRGVGRAKAGESR